MGKVTRRQANPTNPTNPLKRLELFPIGAALQGEPPFLAIAGQRLDELAETYDTPLYIYDEGTLSAALRSYQAALKKHYPGKGRITYAGKAFLCLAMAQWVQRQDAWLDCTGAGELYIAAIQQMCRGRGSWCMA